MIIRMFLIRLRARTRPAHLLQARATKMISPLTAEILARDERSYFAEPYDDAAADGLDFAGLRHITPLMSC